MENQTRPGKLQPLTPEELLNLAESNEQTLQELSEEELEAIAGGFGFRSIKNVFKKIAGSKAGKRIKKGASRTGKGLNHAGNAAMVGAVAAPVLT